MKNYYVLISCYVLMHAIQVEQTYRAAVYAHRIVQPSNTTTNISRKEALANMMKNIEIYKMVAVDAHSKGVQIVVFPKDGIYGFDYSRNGIRPYLEYIPNPLNEQWNPCNEPNRYPDTEIQRHVSCIAASNNMYIVANMGVYKPCDVKQDPKCPTDGHYQFNTNVVYNSNGTLVARYHKTHLFYEYEYDSASKAGHVYFDSSFGRFGMFICFHILWKNPTIDLIEKYNISNFVYSAVWWDTVFTSAPLVLAVQFHSAFAMGMKVN